ncbi:MAG: hypothetical protein ACKVWR_10175 [Acidimicrobiales bacterium]
MEIEPGRFACRWCAHVFERRCIAGRKPAYCARSCRQRAYEQRRRERAGAVTPAAGYLPEAGVNGLLYHALAPDAPADRRRLRRTVCGALARPIPAPFFLHGEWTCRTCSRITQHHPPARQVDVSNDLARLTTLLGRFRRALRRRRAPLEALVDQLLAESPV